MQSMQSMQSILNSEQGLSRRNVLAFVLVCCSDTLKRLVNAVADALIRDPPGVFVYVAKLVARSASVSASWLYKIVFFAVGKHLLLCAYRPFFRRRNRNNTTDDGHRRVCSDADQHPPSDLPVVRIDVDFKSTLHDWSALLSSPHLHFRRHSEFASERIDSKHALLKETLLDVELRTPRFIMRPEHALILHWRVARSVCFTRFLTGFSRSDGSTDIAGNTQQELVALETVDIDSVMKGSTSLWKDMVDLSRVFPFPEFYEDMTRWRLYRADVNTRFIETTASGRYTVDTSLRRAFECIEDRGSFKDNDSKNVCFTDFLLLIDLCAGWLARDHGRHVQMVLSGKFFFDVDLECCRFTMACDHTIFSSNALSKWRRASEVRSWALENLRLYDLKDTEKTSDQGISSSSFGPAAAKNRNKRRLSPSCNITAISDPGCVRVSIISSSVASDDGNRDKNGGLLEQWNTYVDTRCADFDNERKNRLCASSCAFPEGGGVAKFKTYSLRVCERRIDTVETNPQHIKYLEKKRELEALSVRSSSPPSSCSSSPEPLSARSTAPSYDYKDPSFARALTELVASQPDADITVTKIEKYVRRDHVNDFRRELASLYLREEDAKALTTCMYNFKHHPAALSEVGIPNKLGVMLNGPPGTGKTSALAAIATYLERDLYYLHLNDIKCNADLKMVFDYVFKELPEGGVIVMEDVDAMSNVVAARNKKSDYVADSCTDKGNSTVDDGKELTLEFFLNLLQGTLTLDGCVFVATTNHLEALDPAFYRRGRFDVILEMGAADAHQISSMYRRFFKRDIPPKLLERVPEKEYTPAEFISHFAQYLLRADMVDDELILSPFLSGR